MENQPEVKNEVPTPPPAKVSVRTMQSDIKSIQEDGGQMPKPYIAEINQQPKEKEETSASKEVSFQAPMFGAGVSGYSGPEEPMFQAKTPSPLPPGKKTASTEKNAKIPQKGSKTLIMILGIVVLAAILGIGGYYLATNTKGKKTASSPVVPALPETEIVVPALEETPPPATHISLFNALVVQEERVIPVLTLENINNALIAVANTTPADSFKEVVLRGENQSLIGFSKFIPVILPELKSEDVAGLFEEDFTAVVFSSLNGQWPGYIVKLKSATTIDQGQAFARQNMESSANLKNIFLEEPGTAAAFKDGLAGSQTINTRYATFSKPGAAFNYGWINNNLVISASYAGLLEILKNL